ncbi:PREDICTED: serine-rich adhesin for platelets-like [Drosophila arizonae]|uniref:Serine-rich adhesin for platelets-like n=1 Tax=Drosophila arizonae TaxID=7263 RepID=A0ABM1NP01_DROAR|nr:PREDICTED: serine-rich adhesin for platelets-like [Drosophila arizonae]
MQSPKLTLLLLTLCLGARGIWSKRSFEIFNDIWGDLKDGGNSIIEGLRSATRDGAANNKDLLNRLDKANGNFLADALQLGEDLSNGISESLTTGIKDLSQSLTSSITKFQRDVASERNPIKRKALSSGLELLEQLNSEATELKLFDINQKLAKKVNDQLGAIPNDVLSWSKEQLDRVEKASDETGLKQAQDIITKFISSVSKELNAVLLELDVKKSLYEQKLNDKIHEYSEFVNKLIEDMSSCGRFSIFRCKSLIEESIENLRDAKTELLNLRKEGNNLVEAGIKATVSNESFFKKLAENKLKFEKDLVDIISRNPSTTDANGGSSGSNGSSSGASNGASNGGSSGASSGASNGASSGASNGASNGESSGTSNGSSSGASNGASSGASNGASNGGSSGSSSGASNEASLLSRLRESAKNRFKELLNGSTDGAGLQDLFQDVQDAKGQFLDDVTQFGKQISGAISDSLTSQLDNISGRIKDLEGKSKVELNPLKRTTLTSGLAALKELYSTASNVKSAYLDVSNKISEDMGKVNNTLNALLLWAEEQLQRVNSKTNGAGVEKATNIIQEVLTRSIPNLIDAVSDMELRKIELVQQILSNFNYIEDATALIDKLNQCQYGPISAVQCAARVKESVEKLSIGKSKLEIALKNSKALITTSWYESISSSSLLKQLADDMVESERDLDEIIDEHLSHSANESISDPSEDDSEVAGKGDNLLENPSFFGNIGSKLIEGGKSLVGKIWRTRRNASPESSQESSSESSSESSPESSTDSSPDSSSESSSSGLSEKFISNLTASAAKLSDDIAALEEEIKNQENPMQALTTGLTALKSLNKVAAELEAALTDINSQLPEDLNKTITDTLSELSTWKAIQLDTARKSTNAAGLRQAQDTIKLFTEFSTVYLERTLNNYEQQKSIFEKTVQDRIYIYTRDARTLNNTLYKCLEGSMSVDRCTTSVNFLKVKLNNAQNDLQTIIRSSNSLVKAGKYAKGNSDIFLEQLNANKEISEAKIKNIIKFNPTTATTTTTASSESSGDEDTP